MSHSESKDEAWTQRVIDRLKNDLWSAKGTSMLGNLSSDRVDAIVKKLKDELWSTSVDSTDRDAWVTRIIGKLREELWNPEEHARGKKPTLEEEKRVEAILARLKQDLWTP